MVSVRSTISLAGSLTTWSEVQWQDGKGQWHAVETWRAALAETRDHLWVSHWGVASKDYNSGPFRWAVYTGSGGNPPLATSQPFNTPRGPGDVVTIEVTLQ